MAPRAIVPRSGGDGAALIATTPLPERSRREPS